MYLPGDLFIYVVKDHKFGKFLELSTYSYGGVVSGLVSLMVWILVFAICAAVWQLSLARDPANYD